MTRERDVALTLLQALANAAGAEFEDEKMAVDIIEETLKQFPAGNIEVELPPDIEREIRDVRDISVNSHRDGFGNLRDKHYYASNPEELNNFSPTIIWAYPVFKSPKFGLE